MEKNNPERRTSHILNTSANLLGICFLVITTLTKFNMRDGSLIDEVTAVAILVFMSSCIISFIAMKQSAYAEVRRLENVADYIFLFGLVLLFISACLIVLNVF